VSDETEIFLYLDNRPYSPECEKRLLSEREAEVYNWLLDGAELNDLWTERMNDTDWVEDFDYGKLAFFQTYPVGVPLDTQTHLLKKFDFVDDKIFNKGENNKQKEIIF